MITGERRKSWDQEELSFTAIYITTLTFRTFPHLYSLPFTINSESHGSGGRHLITPNRENTENNTFCKFVSMIRSLIAVNLGLT